MKHLLIILSILLLNFPSAVYSAQNRVALVIGNGAYRNAPLRNPVNDARLMRNLLRKAGFSVTIVENARKNELINAIRSFGRSLRNSDAALFYFSGHGNQYKGLNWLLPIGADIQRESDIEFEAVNTDRVLAEMEGDSSKRINIIIFDACRTNRTFRSFRSFNRGLAQPRVQPEGSIVAFSTAPGTVAYDGDGQNSPYVMELKKHLLTPGLKIEDVLKRVRVGVKTRTSIKPTPQIPWENSSLMGDFYFVPQTDGNVISSTSYQNTELVQPNAYNADEEAWNEIRNSSNPEDFITFIRHFADSPLADTAKFKLDRLKKEQTDRPKSVKNLKLTNGHIYTGEFKDGLPNGQGTLIFSERGKHVGEFKDGLPNGQGTLIYDGKIVYVGEWEGAQFHGKGTLNTKDGRKYEGEFRNGQRHGQGTEIFPNGDMFVGNFKDGSPSGQGKETWSNGDMYVGNFKDGLPNGHGARTYVNGIKHIGEFKDGLPNGQGTAMYPSGDWYVGEFKDGSLHGLGTFHWEGNKFVGEFKDGQAWNGTHYNENDEIIGRRVNGGIIKP